MNLHGIARGVVGVVNPEIQATLRKSTGYATGASGKQVPAYATAISGKIQAQELSTSELQHANSLNIQGMTRKIYLPGNWAGVVRADQKGGDIFTFSQYPGKTAQDWMVFVVYEVWPDWSCVGVVLQTTVI